MNCKHIIRQCLQSLNGYRKRHNLHEIIYEDELEQSATEWAKVLRRIDKNTPSLYAGIMYGENILVKRRALNNLTGSK